MIALFPTTLLVSSLAASAASVELNPGDDVAALTASLTAGDEIVFYAGTYPIAEAIEWTGAGTEAAPITLRASGGAVVLDFSGSYEVVYLHDAAYIDIDGITFAPGATNKNNPYALYLENADHVSITNCRFGPAGKGVYLNGDNTALTFDHNEVLGTTDNHGVYVGCSDASCWTQDSSFTNNWIHDVGGEYSYLFYLANGGQNNLILDNVLYGTDYRGMAVNSTEYGDPNLVQGNAIWNTGESGLLVRGPSLVQNNVVFNTGRYGIYTGDNDRATLTNAVISHNTVYDTADYALYMESWSGREGMVLANNALCNTTGYGLGIADGGVDDQAYLAHNVVSGLVTRLEQYAGNDTPVIPGGGDGDFLDPESWNFYPSNGSSLVHAADPASAAWVPETDFNGAPRNGDAPDAGAYERSGETNPGWLFQEGFKTVGDLAEDSPDVVGGCCKGKGGGTESALFAPFLLLALRCARSRARRQAAG